MCIFVPEEKGTLYLHYANKYNVYLMGPKTSLITETVAAIYVVKNVLWENHTMCRHPVNICTCRSLHSMAGKFKSSI